MVFLVSTLATSLLVAFKFRKPLEDKLSFHDVMKEMKMVALNKSTPTRAGMDIVASSILGVMTVCLTIILYRSASIAATQLLRFTSPALSAAWAALLMGYRPGDSELAALLAAVLGVVIATWQVRQWNPMSYTL